MEAPFRAAMEPPYEYGRTASEPNSDVICLKRELMSSRASSQLMRCHACVARAFSPATGPFGVIRRMGYSTRSGEYTRSRYLATFAHRKPRVTGCAGSPWIFVALPSSTVIRTPHASGQSCGQAAWTIFFTWVNYTGEDQNAGAKRRAARGRPLRDAVLVNYGSTRIRPATTNGLPLLASLKTKPRTTRLAEPALCRPTRPLTFSNMVRLPVSTANGPPAA